MAGDSNLAPIVIKRKKVIAGGGHHGGAWKVAYADFVTAMMAFFLLMWLLNATTEKQRKGIADYFSPTIPVNRISGGGDGDFGGDSVFTEDILAQNGRGATHRNPTEADAARGESGLDTDGSEDAGAEDPVRRIEEMLMGRGGESTVTDEALKHIVTRVTDEGLVVELYDLEDRPLFDRGEPTAILDSLADLLAEVGALVENPVAIAGHVRANPIVAARNPVWEDSAGRADTMRRLVRQKGLEPERIRRVTGHADRAPVVADPMAARNNRIEFVFLRSD